MDIFCFHCMKVSFFYYNFLQIDSFGVVGPIVTFVIFLHSHRILVFVQNFAPFIYILVPSLPWVIIIPILEYKSPYSFYIFTMGISMYLWPFHFPSLCLDYATFLIYQQYYKNLLFFIYFLFCLFFPIHHLHTYYSISASYYRSWYTSTYRRISAACLITYLHLPL